MYFDIERNIFKLDNQLPKVTFSLACAHTVNALKPECNVWGTFGIYRNKLQRGSSRLYTNTQSKCQRL